ncbi:Phosphoglycolate phosphatase [Oopsacas minuta]|uniref:Phosphoglycolate phosphatase n=1 Tax=Oopsacas minuta TaxID=111878 RepID=A0AAV7KMQ5_9METZ|nr:Phosphoglycolate phosphatase [Oopsacas minuta]
MNELRCSSEWQELLHSTDTYLFDCDGVVWQSVTPLPGAIEAICCLQKLGKQIYFVTNKNTQSRIDTFYKFSKLGFTNIAIENVYTSSYATAHYLKHVLKLTGKVYLMGEAGMKTEIENAGFTCLDIGPDTMTGEPGEIENIHIDPEVQAVVVATDYHFSYKKLVKAFFYLKNPACHYIGTSEDRVIPVGNGTIIPGATGSFIQAINYSTGRTATVIGKPYLPFINCIESEFPFERSRAVMIGDNLNSDILFAKRAGLKSLLILTGVTKRAEFLAGYKDLPDNLIPDFFSDSLCSLTTQ